MGFYLKQYVKPTNHPDDDHFMEMLSENYSTDYIRVDNLSELTDEDLVFANPVIKGPFILNQRYYCHIRILRLNSDQSFNIELYRSNGEALPPTTQFIKTINIHGDGVADSSETWGDDKGWIDVEFSFIPYNSYEELRFTLVRTQEDYKVRVRFPVIEFVEVSQINNIFSSILGLSNSTIVKLGVHSNPGLKLYLNQSELLVGKSGIYELNNGTITVNYFSVLTPADIIDKEAQKQMEQAIVNLYNEKVIKQTLTDKQIWEQFFMDPSTGLKESCAKNMLNPNNKKRYVNSFVLDYVYKDNIEED